MRTSGMKVAGVAALCGVFATGIVLGATGSGGAHTRPKPKTTLAKGLTAFDSCARLQAYATARAMPLVGPYGVGPYGQRLMVDDVRGGAPMPAVAAPGTGAVAPEATPTAGVDYSGTNVQEEGVDEPDIVKTDGRRAFVASGGGIRSLSVAGGTPKLLDTLKLDQAFGDAQLLLGGDRLIVVSQGPGPVPIPVDPVPGTGSAPGAAIAVAPDIAPYNPGTVVTLVDVGDPSNLRVLETMRLEGRYLAARESGGAVRLVITSQPNPVGLAYPTAPGAAAEQAATAHNRAALASMPVASWLPLYTIQKRGQEMSAVRRAVRCRDVSHPTTQFSGLGMLSVLTIDPRKGLDPVDRDAIMTDGEIVYGSPTSIYVSTPRWIDPRILAADGDIPAGAGTQIHRFEVTSPTATRYRASGRVPGFLLSQWSMSEQDGVLRVASTDEPTWDTTGQQVSASQSQITTLRERDGKLVRVGQLNGLGRGERIYAVRFIGGTGYVVTFRQVDPLYVIDLSDPARPVVRGELKIPGYSAYLHPVGEDLLLGVGQDADAAGRVRGTQVALFDVADPANPKRVSVLRMPLGWSETESDHHAFLYWPATRLAVVPTTTYNTTDGTPDSQAVGVRIGRASGITRVGSVTHPTGANAWQGQIRRSLVVGGSLLTVSEAGMRSSDLGTLAPKAWVAFP